MSYIVWSSELDTGIDVIDEQHKRIVEYINDLYDAHTAGNRSAVASVIDNVMDYTMSHFSFEETMMEDAGYGFLHAHQRVHQMFITRVTAVKARFDAGENVEAELHNMLARWLVNHIRKEDHHYVTAVQEYLAMQQSSRRQQQQYTEKKKGWLARFFGG